MKKLMLWTILAVIISLTLWLPDMVMADDTKVNVQDTMTVTSLFEYKIEEYEGEMAAIITGYTSDFSEKWQGGQLDIPSELAGYPVRVIDEYAFAGQTSITWLIFPEGIKEIRTGAFQNCSRLFSVFIGRTVKYIGNYAFGGCAHDFSMKIYANTYAHEYALENSYEYYIKDYVEYFDTFTGANLVVYDTTLADQDIEFKLEMVTEGEAFERLTKELDGDKVLYKVTMLLGGKEFRPEGNFSVSFPLPDYLSGYHSYGYTVEEDGTLINNGQHGGIGNIISIGWQRMAFQNICSTQFVIAGPHMFGDMDLDYEITAKDALIVLKSVVKLEDLGSAQRTTADVDDNGEVTAKDALCILKKAVKLSELPILVNVPL